MKKAVIFDLDGTLLDTFADLKDAINMLGFYNFPLADSKLVRDSIGYGAYKFVENVLPAEKKSDVKFYHKKYEEFYNGSGYPKTRLFDGIDKLLLELNSKGIKICILSNKPHHSTVKNVEKYLKDYNVDFVLGYKEEVGAKPDPKCIEYVLENLKLDKKDVVMVGDGETDVEVSKNAGVDGIFVLWGYRDKEVLESSGGKLFVKNAKDLLDKILSL